MEPHGERSRARDGMDSEEVPFQETGKIPENALRTLELPGKTTIYTN
jgi:hypothetical protein